MHKIKFDCVSHLPCNLHAHTSAHTACTLARTHPLTVDFILSTQWWNTFPADERPWGLSPALRQKEQSREENNRLCLIVTRTRIVTGESWGLLQSPCFHAPWAMKLPAMCSVVKASFRSSFVLGTCLQVAESTGWFNTHSSRDLGNSETFEKVDMQ